MRPWSRFDISKIQGPFDGIVIGSGMSGLSAAAILSRMGKRILVLEKHYMVGGFTHAFRRKHYEWDVGVHYIGDVGRENSLMHRIFDYCSEGRLQWAPMGNVYDQGIFPDRTFNFVTGKEAFIANLKAAFPKETKAIDAYCELVAKAVKLGYPYLMLKGLPSPVGDFGRFLSRGFIENAVKPTVLQVLSSLTSDPKLIGVLATQWGDYGLPPAQASFLMHALVVDHYWEGGFFPVGGAAAIAETIAPTIEKAGGQIMVRANVEEILVRNNKAVGVRMASGEEIEAPLVVSTCGAINTYTKLLAKDLVPAEILQQMPQVSESTSHLCLYMGMTKSAKDLDMQKANQWIFPSYDHDANLRQFLNDRKQPFPFLFVSFPSSKDPTWEERYPGRSTAEIVTFGAYDWFKKWENTRWAGRGEDYKDLKEELTQRLLVEFRKHNPQLSAHIDCTELSTPLSTRHFCNYSKGEIYGLSCTPNRFMQDWLRPSTPIKNLFLSGQDVVTAGVSGALVSGLVTCGAIVGANPLSFLVPWRSKGKAA